MFTRCMDVKAFFFNIHIPRTYRYIFVICACAYIQWFYAHTWKKHVLANVVVPMLYIIVTWTRSRNACAWMLIACRSQCWYCCALACVCACVLMYIFKMCVSHALVLGYVCAFSTGASFWSFGRGVSDGHSNVSRCASKVRMNNRGYLRRKCRGIDKYRACAMLTLGHASSSCGEKHEKQHYSIRMIRLIYLQNTSWRDA